MDKALIKIRIIGEHSHLNPCHAYVNASLWWAARQLNVELQTVWGHCTSLGADDDYDAIWFIDHGNETNMQYPIITALDFKRPLLVTGEAFFTCAPWLVDSQAVNLTSSDIISNTSGQTNHCQVYIAKNSRLAEHFGLTRSHEHCSHALALNLSKEHYFNRGNVKIVARDGRGDVQAIERIDQPFCVATVFSPESRMMYGVVHPLIHSFVKAAVSIQPHLEQGSLAISA